MDIKKIKKKRKINNNNYETNQKIKKKSRENKMNTVLKIFEKLLLSVKKMVTRHTKLQKNIMYQDQQLGTI
jgi:hypothetical protein